MRKLSHPPFLTVTASLLMALPTQAQTIERVKITDNDLNCAQIHSEITEMDAIAARHAEADAEARNAGNSEVATGIVVDVFGRVLGAFGGVFGQIFGGVATQAATRGVEQARKEDDRRSQENRQQAAARKAHLTTLFVNRGCRASDLTYNPPAPATTPADAVTPQPFLAPPYAAPAKP
jgi:hypothetical protein